MHNTTRTTRTIAMGFGLILPLALLTADLQAASGTWTNTAGGNWNTSGNWSGGIPNAIGDMADFSTIDIPGPTAVNLDIAATVGNMKFNDTGADPDSGYTISGANTLTFNDSDTEATVDVTGGHHEIATAIQLTDTVRFNIVNDATNVSLHLSGKISGGGALKNSNNPSGRLILSNPANDFTGGMTAFNGQGGVEARASGVFGTGAITATPSVGGTWYFTTANQSHANTLNIYGTGTNVNVASGITVDWTGAIQGATANPDKLMFRGTGTLKLSGDNSGLDGGVQVNDSGATVILAHANALGSGDLFSYHQTNPVRVGAAGGDRVYMAGLTSQIFSAIEWRFLNVDGSNLTFNGTVTQNNNASRFNVDPGIMVTLNGNFTGNVTSGSWLQKTGEGTLVLGGSNTTTTNLLPMGWRLVNGTLGFGNDNALQADSSKAFEVVNNANLKTLMAVGGSRTIANPIVLNGGVFIDGSNNLTLNGAVSGTGGITKNGGGILTLGNANSYGGGTTINAGTLQLGDGATNGTVAGNIANSATLVFNNGSSQSYAGTVSGTGSLTKTGAGTLTLSGSSSYTGVTTLTGGTLSVATIGNGGVAGNLGQASNAAGNIVFDGGTLSYSGATASSDRAFTITAGKTATLDVTANTLTLPGATGAATNGGLTKTGNGTLVLSGVNTYTGTTTVSGGMLALGASGSIGGSATIIVASGAELDVSAKSGWMLGTSQTLMGSGTVTGDTIVQGTHAPGSSPGIQPVVGDLTYSGGSSTVEWELISNATAVRGTDFDGIDVSGNLDFAAATALILDFTTDPASAVDWTDGFWAMPHLGTDGWLLYQVGGTTTGIANLTISGTNWQDASGDWLIDVRPKGQFTLYLDDETQYVYLNYSLIPEPASAVLLGLAGLALMRRRVRQA